MIRILWLFFIFLFLIPLHASPYDCDFKLETKRTLIRFWDAPKDTPVWYEIEKQDTSPECFASLFWGTGLEYKETLIASMRDINESQMTYARVYKREKAIGDVPKIPINAYLAITHKTTDSLIGVLSFFPSKKGYYDFGWILAPAYRGQGFGSEVLGTVLPYMRQFVGTWVPNFSNTAREWSKFIGIKASVDINNVTSLKALSKIMTPYKFKNRKIWGVFFKMVQFVYPFQQEARIDMIADLNPFIAGDSQARAQNFYRLTCYEAPVFGYPSRLFWTTFLKFISQSQRASNIGLTQFSTP